MKHRPHRLLAVTLSFLLGVLPMQSSWAMPVTLEQAPPHSGHSAMHDHAQHMHQAAAQHDCEHCKNDPSCADHAGCASLHCSTNLFSSMAENTIFPHARAEKPSLVALQLHLDHIPASFERPPRL